MQKLIGKVYNWNTFLICIGSWNFIGNFTLAMI